MSSLVIRQCRNPQCFFRFPAPASGSKGVFCPLCGWETEIVHPSFPSPVPRQVAQPLKLTGPPVEALLDSIRSTYNVGSMFRAADGAGLRHLHLCGITPTPDNPKVSKTSLGAEKSVPWSYNRNSVIAVQNLKKCGLKVFSLEASPNSQSIFDLGHLLNNDPILLIVGNEITGVDPDVLAISDQVVWIPMQGQKESLNVALAFGIAAYTLRFSYQNHYI